MSFYLRTLNDITCSSKVNLVYNFLIHFFLSLEKNTAFESKKPKHLQISLVSWWFVLKAQSNWSNGFEPQKILKRTELDFSSIVILVPLLNFLMVQFQINLFWKNKNVLLKWIQLLSWYMCTISIIQLLNMLPVEFQVLVFAHFIPYQTENILIIQWYSETCTDIQTLEKSNHISSEWYV